MADAQVVAQLLHHHHLSVARGDAHYGFNFSAGGVVKACAVDVIGGHNALQRGLNHLFGRGRNHVELEMVAVQVLEKLHEQADILFQADPLAGFDQVMLANAPEFRVVQQQIGQLSALLHHVDARQAGDALLES